MDGSYSVIFKLCYKEYEYKPSLKAIKDFKEATGLDMWGVLSKYMSTYLKCRAEGVPLTDMLNELAKVIDFVDSAVLFHCLAKQSSSVSIDEIEDAMFHAGILPTEADSDMSEPYPMVIYMLALDINKYHETVRAETKKQ